MSSHSAASNCVRSLRVAAIAELCGAPPCDFHGGGAVRLCLSFVLEFWIRGVK